MSDHDILGLFLVIIVALGIGGFVFLAMMLCECQRLTRAVAGLVYQEGERTRAALTTPPPC